MGAAGLGELVRNYWSIENQLHWCLDVSFGDDASRVRKRRGLVNLAAVQRLARGLLKRSIPDASTPAEAKRTSLKARRLLCGWSAPYLIQTLTGGDRR